MPRNIIQAVFLPAAPERVYDMYLDAEQHAAFTGAPVDIDPRAGGEFRAFDGMLTGTLLQLVAGRLIVQSWRSGNWPKEAIDSTLTLSFWSEGASGSEGEGTRIELVHANVPEVDFSGVSQGWERYYWTPWREYLQSRG